MWVTDKEKERKQGERERRASCRLLETCQVLPLTQQKGFHRVELRGDYQKSDGDTYALQLLSDDRLGHLANVERSLKSVNQSLKEITKLKQSLIKQQGQPVIYQPTLDLISLRWWLDLTQTEMGWLEEEMKSVRDACKAMREDCSTVHSIKSGATQADLYKELYGDQVHISGS